MENKINIAEILKDCSYKPSKMTREELLNSRAYNISISAGEYYSNNPKSDSMTSYEEGAKWADKTMIEKACEWLEENIDIYAKVVINPKSHYPEIVMCDSFEKSFKKAMEK